jgi:soluble lytic murein transglycosylase-like protein
MVRTALVLALTALAAAPAAGGTIEITTGADGVKRMKNEPSEARARRLAADLVAIPEDAIATLIDRWAAARELDAMLVQAVVQVESGYNVRALSSKGAKGLMQLMPGTARELGVTDPYDAEQNVRAGTAYLRRMFDRFGNLEWALAAYNAGPEAVERHSGIPPFAETREYVRRVLCLLDGVCPEGAPEPEREGRPVRIIRDANNRIRLTTSGAGG